MTFVSRGSEAPELTDFHPKEATWDDEITFVGKNFSAIENNVTVNFGPYKAFVVRSSAEEIIVKVPYELTTFQREVAVSLGSQTTTMGSAFVLKPPVIQSVSPASASIGDEVTFTGQYLNSTKTRVYFGAVATQLKSISKTNIVCLVPVGPAGTLKVTVRTGEGDLVDNIDFNIQ